MKPILSAAKPGFSQIVCRIETENDTVKRGNYRKYIEKNFFLEAFLIRFAVSLVFDFTCVHASFQGSV